MSEVHDHAPPEESAVTAPRSRRRILGMLGAGGLATAAAVFGRSTPALAGNYNCCNLAFPPPSSKYVSYSTCKTYTNYDWLCTNGAGLYCQCCEGKNSAGTTVVSGASCKYN
ncbi:hypothetical protein [Dactylosporangium salmoneum]|uniref:Twin-arginine translocation signal domain-containing protein n=1 Tax=Dactylosporangium salmoneum TaxID=53361 RepID=A0ABP5SEQ9_9ACTN